MYHYGGGQRVAAPRKEIIFGSHRNTATMTITTPPPHGASHGLEDGTLHGTLEAFLNLEAVADAVPANIVCTPRM
jgi:hypothetical protein